MTSKRESSALVRQAEDHETVEKRQPPPLPPATKWLLLFQACNACNFTIGLGAPLILTARFLGAGEFHIGLLNAIAPLMVSLQLFTTNLLERVGYRQLMLLGWGLRSFMLLLIVPLPFLTDRFSSTTLVWALIVPILLFNTIRGLAAGAWFPWLSEILPPNQRGYYLGLEQGVMNVSAFVTLLLAGQFLGAEPTPWRYGFLFFVAWCAGMLSVRFLKRMPPSRPANPETSNRRFREIIAAARRSWKHQPFRRVTQFVCIYTIALSSLPVFLVLYLRDEVMWSERTILAIQSVSPLGVLITAIFWGRLSDRIGSRPILRVALTGQLFVLAYWILAAAGAVTPQVKFVAISYLLLGITTAAHMVSQTRLVLGSTPPKEVNISMAILQVCIAFAAGLSPLLWGWLLEGLGRATATWDVHYSPAYLFFFATSILVGFVAQILLFRIRERRALLAGRILMQAIYDWPVKVLSSVWIVRGRERPRRRRK